MVLDIKVVFQFTCMGAAFSIRCRNNKRIKKDENKSEKR